MAAKPESTFIAAVHRPLKGKVYCEKNNNPFRAGTPDVWYSGDLGDLWIEYKYTKSLPITADILPDTSPRQNRWLNNRFDEGRNVAVVLGTQEGCVIYRGKSWMLPLSPAAFREQMIPKGEVSSWIQSQVGASKCTTLE